MSAKPAGPAAPRRVPPWRDPRVRAAFFQVLVIAVVLATGAWLVHNLMRNLEVRGISTGFGFLSRRAGFGINQTLIAYSESSSYGRTFLVGLLNTLLVSGLGIVCATILGFVVGIARLSRNWLVAKLAAAYVEIFRNIPLLVQILFWYFAVFLNLPPPRQALHLGSRLPHAARPVRAAPRAGRGLRLDARGARRGFRRLLGARALGEAPPGGHGPALPRLPRLGRGARGRARAPPSSPPARPLAWERPALHGFNFTGGFTLIPELAALLVALSVYTAAFIAEVVRAGIQAVSHGQTEAAAALGLKRSWTMRLVVIPQAMRVIVPPLTSQYLNLTKNSSLATAIGYPDLVSLFAGTTLNQTGQAVEVMAMTMAVYLVISLVISAAMNLFNARMALVER